MSLSAAAGKVDLSAKPGLWLTGFGDRERPSEGKLDPIEARAAILADQERAVAMVVLDLIGLDAESVACIRAHAPGVEVLVSCTHTHAGPASMRLRGVMGFVDREWLAAALRRTGDLVAGLLGSLRPATMAFGTAEAAGLAYNRQPGGGPLVETVTAIGVRDSNGAPLATIGSFACHPVVLGNRNFVLSADFPGAFARAIDATGGVGLFLQGCAGDIDPALHRDRGWGAGAYDDVQAIGARLAEAAGDALAGAAWRADVTVRAASRHVRVPLAPRPAPEGLADFEAGHRAALEAAMSLPDPLAEALGAGAQPSVRAPREACVPMAMLEWLQDYRRLERDGQLPGHVSAEVWLARFGEWRIVGVPFEAYTGVGQVMAEALRPGPALALGYANGLIGYLPTDAAMAQGGYGPGDSHIWFPKLPNPVATGAAGVLIDAARSVGL
jgi:hypothetical protein